MKKNLIYSLFAIAVLFSACSTDLDVTGDWKETMVIYGLLDQGKDTQYIKINKAFLGQGDAVNYAQIKDSVQFSHALTVQLQRFLNGTAVGAPIALQPDNTIPKETGTFYSGDQTNAIYSFVSTGANILHEDSEYKLSVKNAETGNEATSQTVLVKDFSFTKPSAGSPTFYFVNPASPNYPFVVEWNTSKNARLYQLVIRFNYKDSTLATGTVVNRHVDWSFPTRKTERLTGGEVMTTSFVGQDFLKYIGANVPVTDNTIVRICGQVELMVTGGSDDLSTFIDVNKPSTGIIQDKPEFTNITNGLGLFASRYSKASFKRPMQASSIDSVAGGQFTCTLRFLDKSGVLTGCH